MLRSQYKPVKEILNQIEKDIKDAEAKGASKDVVTKAKHALQDMSDQYEKDKIELKKMRTDIADRLEDELESDLIKKITKRGLFSSIECPKTPPKLDLTHSRHLDFLTEQRNIFRATNFSDEDRERYDMEYEKERLEDPTRSPKYSNP